MPYLLRDVFTPGGLPSVTYVSREHLQLEKKIADALARGYAFNVVTGPTKSGKSVLCRRVLQASRPVIIEGGQIRSEDDFWNQIGFKLNLAVTASTSRTSRSTTGRSSEVGGGIPGFAKAKAGLEASDIDESASSLTYRNVQMLAGLTKLLESKSPLVVDDFHYIDQLVQRAIIRSLKAAVFDGLPVFLIAVPHRAFDPVTVENEVEGRFKHVSIPKWALEDLLLIPRRGFEALNLTVERAVQRQICGDSFGNPLLVQEICTEFCLQNGVDSQRKSTLELDPSLLEPTYKEMAQSKGFPTYQSLKSGPGGGRARHMWKMAGGGTEDIYTAVLASIARLGPRTATTLDQIHASLNEIIGRGERTPARRDIAAILQRLSKIARERTQSEPAVEWRDQESTLVIIDPFLMFFLKWSFRD